MVRISHLSFRYSQQDRDALADISLTIEKGSWTSIIGRSGSGKSTLVKLLAGLLENQSEDAIELFHETVSEKNLDRIRSRIGLVFQNPDNQFVGPTVADDVAFGLENLAMPRSQMTDAVTAALREVGMLSFYNWQPERLSGGQKQRVALAGVLVLKADLLILDEATSMVDPLGRRDLLLLVKKLQKQHDLTVLSITHDTQEALMADHILVMHQGRIVLDGRPETVFSQDQKMTDLGLALPLNRRIQETLLAEKFDLPTAYLGEKALIEALWRLYSNK